MRKNYGIKNYLPSGKTIYTGRYISNFNFSLWYTVPRVKLSLTKTHDGDDFDKYIRGSTLKERLSGVQSKAHGYHPE